MRKTLTSSTTLLLAALALPAMGVSAFAQSSPTSGAATTMPMAAAPPSDSMTAKPHAGRHHSRQWSPEDRAKRVEARIAKLHEELGITTAQEPQWKVFAQVMRDNAGKMGNGFETRGARLSTMSAADNMQSYADMAVQHAQDIQRLAMAFQSVYNSLSTSQKSDADMLFRARHERHQRHGQHMKGTTAPSKP